MTRYPTPPHQAVPKAIGDVLSRLTRLENRTNAVGTNADGTITIANLRIVNSTMGQILVYNGAPALGNLVMSLSSVAGTDIYGNAYPAGLMLGSKAANDGTQLVFDPADQYAYPTLRFAPQDVGQSVGPNSAAYQNAVPWPNGPAGVVASGIGINTGQYAAFNGVTQLQRLYLNQGGSDPVGAMECIDSGGSLTGGQLRIRPDNVQMAINSNGSDSNTACWWNLTSTGHVNGSGALARDQNQGATTMFFYDIWGSAGSIAAGSTVAFALSFGATYTGPVHFGASAFDGGPNVTLCSFLSVVSATGYTVSVKNIGSAAGTGANIYSQAWRCS